MNRILITGRMGRSTLDRALYSGWAVESYVGTDKGNCVAIITSTVANSSPEYMAGRLSSFGTVGVRTEFTADDINDAMARMS